MYLTNFQIENIVPIYQHHCYRRSGQLYRWSVIPWDRTQDNHSPTGFRAQLVRSIDNGRDRTRNNAIGPFATHTVHIAQRQSAAVYNHKRYEHDLKMNWELIVTVVSNFYRNVSFRKNAYMRKLNNDNPIQSNIWPCNQYISVFILTVPIRFVLHIKRFRLLGPSYAWSSIYFFPTLPV